MRSVMRAHVWPELRELQRGSERRAARWWPVGTAPAHGDGTGSCSLLLKARDAEETLLSSVVKVIT